MTSDAIIARNRSTARKSTGPKTARVEAVVARNARKHGATAPSDQESITIWLAIIRDDPEVTAQDLLPQNDLGFRGLMLAKAEAEAEVRLAKTERALRDFEADDTDPSVPRDALQEACAHLAKAITKGTISARGAVLLTAMMILLKLQCAKIDLHRTLKRYIAGARTQSTEGMARRRRCGPALPAGGSRKRQIPKRTQFSRIGCI